MIERSPVARAVDPMQGVIVHRGLGKNGTYPFFSE
jgi:hypothetical protein